MKIIVKIQLDSKHYNINNLPYLEMDSVISNGNEPKLL